MIPSTFTLTCEKYLPSYLNINNINYKLFAFEVVSVNSNFIIAYVEYDHACDSYNWSNKLIELPYDHTKKGNYIINDCLNKIKEITESYYGPKGGPKDENSFEKDLESLINRYSLENESDTPDFILANYLKNCLTNFNTATISREKWYSKNN